MSKRDIEHVWNLQPESRELPRFSLTEIRAIRESVSNDTTSSVRTLILFDMVYKGLVIIIYAGLLIVGRTGFPEAGVRILVIALLSSFLFRCTRHRSHLYELDETGDILSTLRTKYDFLSGYYRDYLIMGSVTNPLFVLGCFQWYLIFKYQDDRFLVMMADPVTYLFLALSFVVPFVAQKITSAKELKGLETIMGRDLDDANGRVALSRLKAEKRERQIMFSITALIGLVVLLALIMRFL